MFCGTPVIAFSKGSMPEIIEHGKTGFLVHSTGQAIENICDIIKIDRKYCRDYALKRFSQKKMVNDYIKIYNQILKGDTPPEKIKSE